MPQTPHTEKHFKGSDTVRDIVIGMSDGLTVPFALAAGLSGAVDTNAIIIIAGLAEISAGSISMGLGGYLAARTDSEFYAAEEAREEREVKEVPEKETKEVVDIFRACGLPESEAKTCTASIKSEPKRWVDFMMKYELGLEKPDRRRGLKSALTIAFSYIAGGIVPLSPYFFVTGVKMAFLVSVAVTFCALLAFGYIKGRYTSTKPFRSAWRTVAVGVAASAAAYFIVKMIG